MTRWDDDDNRCHVDVVAVMQRQTELLGLRIYCLQAVSVGNFVDEGGMIYMT